MPMRTPFQPNRYGPWYAMPIGAREKLAGSVKASFVVVEMRQDSEAPYVPGGWSEAQK